MEVEYRITAKSQLANYWFIIALAVIYSVGCYFLIVITKGKGVYFFICFFTIIYLVQALILFILHRGYYAVNKGDELICDYDNKQTTYIHNNVMSVFKSTDIKKVIHFVSKDYTNKQLGRWPWDKYNYCKMYFFDGRAMIITSLLVVNIEDFFDKMSINKDKITQDVNFINNVNTK